MLNAKKKTFFAIGVFLLTAASFVSNAEAYTDLSPGTIVCRTGYDVYSYYYHSYHNNAGNLTDLFANGLCWKLKGSRRIIWVSKEIKEHAYEKSVKILYYDKGNKIIAHTHPKNVH